VVDQPASWSPPIARSVTR